MENAFAWLGNLIEWFGKLIPRLEVLDTTTAAVKFVRGQPKFCTPGAMHVYWPVTTLWNPYPTARQVDRLETQVMESIDGTTFMVSGTLAYEITDLMALVPTTENPMAAIGEIASTALHDVLCTLTWEELKTEQRKGTLKTKLKNVAQRELQEYGVSVIRFKLNTLSKCRVFKVSQSTASEEN